MIEIPAHMMNQMAFIDPSLIVFLLIGLGSAISSWLQKRRLESEGEAPDDDEWARWKDLSKGRPEETGENRPTSGQSGPAPAQKERRPFSLERELKELLGETFGEPKPSQEPPAQGQGVPVPAPIPNQPYQPPVIASQPRPQRKGSLSNYEAPEIPALQRNVEQEEADLAKKKKQAQAFVKNLRDSKLRAKRKRRADFMPALRSPQGLRQAVIASVILGKPKAMEDQKQSDFYNF